MKKRQRSGLFAAGLLALMAAPMAMQAQSVTLYGSLSNFDGAVRINGLGTVGTNPAGTRFAEGSVVTLAAATAESNVFSGWAGACAGTALTCTVTITADTSVTANFSGAVAPPPPPPPAGTVFRLDVNTNGNGSVASSPTGRDFNAGTVVTLTATPNAGQPWTGWTGGCTGISRTCTVTMNANTAVTANFR